MCSFRHKNVENMNDVSAVLSSEIRMTAMLKSINNNKCSLWYAVHTYRHMRTDTYGLSVGLRTRSCVASYPSKRTRPVAIKDINLLMLFK
jgi:hypothetical protein